MRGADSGSPYLYADHGRTLPLVTCDTAAIQNVSEYLTATFSHPQHTRG